MKNYNDKEINRLLAEADDLLSNIQLYETPEEEQERKLKEELQRQGKTSVWLANELGCHRTNIYKVYDRTTIDTGMLFHISKILKVDFFKYYSDALSSKRKK